jgi:hypothetical protein
MKSTPRSSTIRRWFQFRLRTLLLGMAVLALAMGLGPKLWHRHRVNQAIERIVEEGVGDWPILSSRGGVQESLVLVGSDIERATAILMHVVRNDPDSRHRIHAIQAMRAVHHYGGTAEIRRRHLGELIGMATGGRAPVAVERELAETITDWMNVGVDATERTLILNRAKQVDDQLLCVWLGVLIEIGGREELEFVFQHVDTDDEEVLRAILNSSLINCRWPGMLPHVQQWLGDPAIAECRLLEYGVLHCSPEGREVLLQYILDPANPDKLRRIGFEQLQDYLAGVGLLLKTAQTPQGAEALRQLAIPDLVATLEAKRAELQQPLGSELWEGLIERLNPSSEFPNWLQPSPEAEQQLSEMRRKSVDDSLRCLKILSGQDDVTEADDWRRWYEAESPPAFTQREILQLVSEHPELLTSGYVLRRISANHLGYVPTDCLPLYLQIAEDGPDAAAWWACRTLLMYTDNVTCVPYAIDMIDRNSPSNTSSLRSGVIAMLQERFAVNFFWDADAWRLWWSEYQENQVTRAIEEVQE